MALSPRPARPRLLADVTPLRDSPPFRRLFFGQMASFVGSEFTRVAIPYQVFLLTRSSLQVGLVSLAQFVPLVVGSLAGGVIADTRDRRRLLLVMQALQAVTALGLAGNALLERPSIPAIYALSALAAALSGVDRPARSAVIPNLVGRQSLAAAYALWQVLLQIGGVAGPAVAGVLIAKTGLAPLYWLDALSFGVAFLFLIGLPPLPPAQLPSATWARKGRTRSALAGLRFARSRQELLGIFLIDLDAMVLGMPRALFPAMSEATFGGGATTYGLLSAAPGAGALVGAVSAGWVGRVRRQGVAVIAAVALWGLSIAAFGVVPWLWAALFLLALAGAADVVSAIFRNTILHTTVPDALRGRLSALQIAVVAGGPRLGDVEAGAVAAFAGVRGSVLSGGLGCLAGAALVAWRLPHFRRYVSPTTSVAEARGPEDAAGPAAPATPG